MESGVNNMRRVGIDRHGNRFVDFFFLAFSVRSVDLQGLWGEDMVWPREWTSQIGAAGESVWPDWLQH